MPAEESDQPLSLAWPVKKRKRAMYLAVLPIVFPLWMTLPDVRNAVSIMFCNAQACYFFIS